jgi:rod shape determining protein RodA
MIAGFLPVVGVPLPLFSYGGSSLLTTMVGLGLLMNVRMRRFQSSMSRSTSA